MTDEERLQEYLRQNAPKPKKAEKAEIPKPVVAEPVKPKSRKKPTAWYVWGVLGEAFWITVMALFFPVCFFAFMEDKGHWETDYAYSVGYTWVASVLAISVGWTAFRIYRYVGLINDRYYKLKGWEEFFGKRSEDFWDERNYTNVRISFNLNAEASDLHRQALKVFTAKIIKKWNKQYQDKDLEWIGSIPKDLSSDGRAIYGDVSQRELPWVVKILVKFIPLSRLLNDHLVEVVVSSSAKEKTHEMKEEKDDPMDRAESWNRRHGLND